MRIYLIITLLYFNICNAQNVQEKYFSKQQIQEDYTLIKRALLEVHPSLNWYTPKEELDKSFTEVENLLQDSLSEKQLYKLLMPLISKVRCGHTYLQYSNETQMHLYDKESEWLPFIPIIYNDKLFIGKNLSTDSTLQAGSELLEIEGMKGEVLLNEMRKYSFSDGYNNTFKDVLIEQGFFDEFFWMILGAKDNYTMTIKDTLGYTRTITTKYRNTPAAETKPQENTRKTKKIAQKQKLDKIINIKYLNEKVAILSINGFVYDEISNIKKLHKKIFKEIKNKKIEHLAIDFQKNSGGNNEIGVDLMRYLLDSTFVLLQPGITHVKVPFFLPYLQKRESKQKNFDTTKIVKNKKGEYEFRSGSIGSYKPYKKNRFKGKLYVFTSGFTFSAASLFVSSLKAQKDVTIIGNETGGGQAGCNGGMISAIVLPNTKMTLRFPHFRLMSYQPNKNNNGRGVFPDIWLIPTPQERIHKKNVFIEKLLSITK
ncbi:MAG: S41 family peptidase [Raineya sp.]|jgi:hypothetical protein|nr:S41 family peptidase [Raineya sp.]